jgi:hypothetical protein
MQRRVAATSRRGFWHEPYGDLPRRWPGALPTSSRKLTGMQCTRYNMQHKEFAMGTVTTSMRTHAQLKREPIA